MTSRQLLPRGPAIVTRTFLKDTTRVGFGRTDRFGCLESRSRWSGWRSATPGEFAGFP